MKKQIQRRQSCLWLLFMIVMTGLNAQTILYEENVGTPTATTLVQNYSGWQNTEVLYIGDGTCDVRLSSASLGYGLASGGGNVMLNDTVKWFQISGINTSTASTPNLYLGIRKTTAVNGANLLVQVSTDSLSWTTMTISDTLPTGTGTSGWYRVHYNGLPVCGRLHLRFSNSSSSDCRIDDIAVVDGEEIVLETVADPVISPSSGLYYESQTVTMNTVTEDAVIYYTTDGTAPTIESTVYTSPFSINTSTTVKAFAIKEGMYDSEVVTSNILIQDTNSLVSLPFDISTNSTTAHEDITMMSGFRGYHLGSSYADGSAKFEATHVGEATLVAHLDSAPEHLSFDLKGKVGGSSPAAYEGATIEVSESVDGQTWTIFAAFSDPDIPLTEYGHFTGMTLDPESRYVRWRLVEAIKGNTQLNNIVISKYTGQADTTAVVDYLHAPVSCYPNPTNGQLYFTDGGMQILSMTLTNLCGVDVLTWAAPVNSPLNLTSLPAGTYLLTIRTAAGTMHTKVTKY
ncbi:MAG: chitobiase/beta-hexosaminidase C-terminal domain-containing protein [Bacteroidales bacterium]|nr:chitobiase/beta-hexosaminidase C-terminal domain-containing protein [Bacteroidales bacterium]